MLGRCCAPPRGHGSRRCHRGAGPRAQGWCFPRSPPASRVREALTARGQPQADGTAWSPHTGAGGTRGWIAMVTTRQSEGTRGLCPSLPPRVWVRPTPLVKPLPKAPQHPLEGKVGSEPVAARAGERPPEAIETEAHLRGRFQKTGGRRRLRPTGKEENGRGAAARKRPPRNGGAGAGRDGEKGESKGPLLQRAQVTAGAASRRQRQRPETPRRAAHCNAGRRPSQHVRHRAHPERTGPTTPRREQGRPRLGSPAATGPACGLCSRQLHPPQAPVPTPQGRAAPPGPRGTGACC